MKAKGSMKKLKKKKETEFRSYTDFRNCFYPKPNEPDALEFANPTAVGERLAHESLCRLQTALTAPQHAPK